MQCPMPRLNTTNSSKFRSRIFDLFLYIKMQPPRCTPAVYTITLLNISQLEDKCFIQMCWPQRAAKLPPNTPKSRSQLFRYFLSIKLKPLYLLALYRAGADEITNLIYNCCDRFIACHNSCSWVISRTFQNFLGPIPGLTRSVLDRFPGLFIWFP